MHPCSSATSKTSISAVVPIPGKRLIGSSNTSVAEGLAYKSTVGTLNSCTIPSRTTRSTTRSSSASIRSSVSVIAPAPCRHNTISTCCYVVGTCINSVKNIRIRYSIAFCGTTTTTGCKDELACSLIVYEGSTTTTTGPACGKIKCSTFLTAKYFDDMSLSKRCRNCDGCTVST